MRVLITGIAGFIGFHLALFLKERGDDVLGCDNFNSYYTPSLKQARAQQLALQGIPVIEADICEPGAVERMIARSPRTHLIHLAAQAGVRHALFHPEQYVQANLAGFVQVLEACRRHPDTRLIYASSSSVYGLNKKVPFSEEDPVDRPANLYGATKRSNELMASSYHHLFGLSAVGLRYFTVYGPWGRPDMAYFSFARSICRGEPILLHNEGQMQRDFTYIDDIVRGTAQAMELESTCELFNLGSDRPIELMALVDALERALGKKAIVEKKPLQAGEVLQTHADLAKSRERLGFVPRVDFNEGIGRFVRWYLDSGQFGVKDYF